MGGPRAVRYSVAMPSQSEPLVAEAHQVEPGTIIAERYRVEAILGEGGMGIVYLAEHVHIRKRVAIKVLLPQWATTPEVVARFERESVAAGAIEHPNVAAATDFGRLADGSFFLVLEYLEGRTLRSELEGGAIPPARALEIARGVALGVGAAHAKGIVHRDLKPENVMLVERDGDPYFVKVVDFGIARVEGCAAANGQVLTSAGEVLGTPDYMAPEQVLGGNVDHRADLYALGVMLFEMLTGECPFRGGAATLLRQHVLNEVPPPLPPEVALRLPESLRGMAARLMQKDPGARFESATELVATIDKAFLEMAQATTPRRAPDPVVPVSAESPSLRGWAVSSAQHVMREPRTRARALFVGVLAVVVVTAVGLRSSSGRVAETKGTTSGAMPVNAGAPSTSAHAEEGASPSASGTPNPPPSATPSPPPSATPRKRRTGPGGIYIPPPSRWFR